MTNEEKKKIRLGMKGINNDGLEMKIVKYRGATDIDIKFTKSGIISKNKNYVNFLNGQIKEYSENFGKRIIADIDINCNNRLAYETWRSMQSRIENKYNKSIQSVYNGVTICNEWNSFKVFNEWFDKNYKWDLHNKGIKLELDKDILSDIENKIYSPDTCVFVPKNVNIFMKRNLTNKFGYTGIHIGLNSTNKPYQARVVEFMTGKRNSSCYYSTVEEAHKAWVEMKNIELISVKKYMLGLGYSFDIVEKIFYWKFFNGIQEKCYNKIPLPEVE